MGGLQHILSFWRAAWQTPSFRRLILAIIISLGLHLFFIGEFPINLPNWENEHQALEARLILPKAKQPSQPSVKKIVKAPREPEPVKKVVTESQPVSPTPELPAETSSNPATEDSIEGLPSAAIEPETIKPPEPLVTENLEDIPALEDAGLMVNADAYKYVETEFDVRTNAAKDVNSRAEGHARIVYKLLRNGEQYRLESLIEPKGLAALVIPDLLQTSEGFLSSQGLRPTHYLYQFGDKKDKTYQADMDWEREKLKLQTSKGIKEIPLATGTQDLLSFMYQFMFIPPPQNMQLNITNGKKLDIYQYFFAGEETINSKMGELRTVHIYRDNNDNDERSELWLALDYQYVPVKIRKTEQENKVYELLATSIKTESPPESQP